MARNPWDSAVQFRDELITRTFPPGSGFEATYRFTIEGNVPKPLHIVIERPDLYTIACNGAPVSARKDSWWLDKAFGKIDITSAAKSGENTVAIKASPMTLYHELESAYVLGDFSLKAADSGFVIAPPQPITLGRSDAHVTAPDGSGMRALGWDRQGCPFYAEGVSYKQEFIIAQTAGKYYVRLPNWCGSVARVTVNGKPAGHIYRQPWECDVTKSVRIGLNTVEVVVVGTLKNTLGPHHGNPPLGSAWPGMFQNGPETGPPPGRQYSTVAYGLFAPFELHAQ
jgi:hypothetical protein